MSGEDGEEGKRDGGVICGIGREEQSCVDKWNEWLELIDVDAVQSGSYACSCSRLRKYYDNGWQSKCIAAVEGMTRVVGQFALAESDILIPELRSAASIMNEHIEHISKRQALTISLKSVPPDPFYAAVSFPGIISAICS